MIQKVSRLFSSLVLLVSYVPALLVKWFISTFLPVNLFFFVFFIIILSYLRCWGIRFFFFSCLFINLLPLLSIYFLFVSFIYIPVHLFGSRGLFCLFISSTLILFSVDLLFSCFLSISCLCYSPHSCIYLFCTCSIISVYYLFIYLLFVVVYFSLGIHMSNFSTCSSFVSIF